MNNKVECRCCDPPLKFYDYSGRSKHEKSRMKKSTLTSTNLKQIPVAYPVKSTSQYDTRSNASSQNSRTSRASQRAKTKKFSELVNGPTIQLNKKMVPNLITDAIISIVNEYSAIEESDDSPADVDMMKKKLNFFPALQNYDLNEDIHSKIQNYAEEQLAANNEETLNYSHFLTNLRQDLKTKIEDSKQSEKKLSHFNNQSDFVKNLRLKKETGQYLKSTEMIGKELHELETFNLPFIQFQIQQIKEEIAHRKRIIQKKCYELLIEAITPVYETEPLSQNDWDIPLPEVTISSAKKARR